MQVVTELEISHMQDDINEIRKDLDEGSGKMDNLKDAITEIRVELAGLVGSIKGSTKTLAVVGIVIAILQGLALFLK